MRVLAKTKDRKLIDTSSGEVVGVAPKDMPVKEDARYLEVCTRAHAVALLGPNMWTLYASADSKNVVVSQDFDGTQADLSALWSFPVPDVFFYDETRLDGILCCLIMYRVLIFSGMRQEDISFRGSTADETGLDGKTVMSYGLCPKNINLYSKAASFRYVGCQYSGPLTTTTTDEKKKKNTFDVTYLSDKYGVSSHLYDIVFPAKRNEDKGTALNIASKSPTQYTIEEKQIYAFLYSRLPSAPLEEFDRALDTTTRGKAIEEGKKLLSNSTSTSSANPFVWNASIPL